MTENDPESVFSGGATLPKPSRKFPILKPSVVVICVADTGYDTVAAAAPTNPAIAMKCLWTMSNSLVHTPMF